MSLRLSNGWSSRLELSLNVSGLHWRPMLLLRQRHSLDFLITSQAWHIIPLEFERKVKERRGFCSQASWRLATLAERTRTWTSRSAPSASSTTPASIDHAAAAKASAQVSFFFLPCFSSLVFGQSVGIAGQHGVETGEEGLRCI